MEEEILCIETIKVGAEQWSGKLKIKSDIAGWFTFRVDELTVYRFYHLFLSYKSPITLKPLWY